MSFRNYFSTTKSTMADRYDRKREMGEEGGEWEEVEEGGEWEEVEGGRGMGGSRGGRGMRGSRGREGNGRK
jgi:hypothetical protein